jgi:5'(3')-deoxyribonucleotidase
MRLGIDMDGTTVDFTTASFNKVKELYGIELTLEDAKVPKTSLLVWERMTDEQKSRYSCPEEMYKDICTDGFFLELEPFPGAIESVKQLADAGHEIVWITKVLNWHRSANEKNLWLEKYFSDIKYTKIMVDSVHAKQLIDVDVIIDDDAYVLKDITKSIPIMIRQPWNLTSRGLYTYEVDDMVEAAKIVMDLSQEDEWWNTKGMHS